MNRAPHRLDGKPPTKQNWSLQHKLSFVSFANFGRYLFEWNDLFRRFCALAVDDIRLVLGYPFRIFEERDFGLGQPQFGSWPRCSGLRQRVGNLLSISR